MMEEFHVVSACKLFTICSGVATLSTEIMYARAVGGNT